MEDFHGGPKPVAGPGKSSSSAAPSLSHEDVDLPAPLSPPPLADLPAPKIGGASLDLDPFGDAPTAVDLPAPKPEAEPRPSGFDPFADMDLPAPLEGASETDLPAPMSSTDRGGTDLPALRGGGSFDEEIDLPMALTDAELPAPMSMSSDLPMPLEQENLPVPRGDFSDPPLDGPMREHGGGPIELDLPDGEDLSLDMELDPGVNRPAPVPPLPTVGGPPGPASERPDPGDRVSRDSAELDLPVSDDLEFSELPSLEEGEADVHRMPHPGDGTRAPAKKQKRSVDIRRALAKKRPPWLMKLVAAAVGASFVLGLGFYLGNTKYGLFGVHVIEPFLPGAGDVVETTQAIQSAEADAADDTYSSTRQGLAQLEGALGSARLNRALVARALLHQSFFQIRYGQDAQSAAEADAHRMHLKRRGDEASGIHVALAANALRQNDLGLARSELALAKAEDASDPYVDLVEGELALASKDPKSATDAFGRAFSKDGSARAQWGIARSHRLAGNAEDLAAAANATLEASPAHAGARVAVAEGLAAQGDTDGAYALLQAPAGLVPDDGGKTSQVARADRSAALALVARIEEQRGRLGAAREMYEKAVELDASNAWAALGAARLVLLDGGYQDALARFQTVIGAEVTPGAELHPTGQPRVLVEAKLGAAEALIAMDKPGQAKKLLSEFETDEPVNADVEIWQGKIADAMGDSAASWSSPGQAHSGFSGAHRWTVGA